MKVATTGTAREQSNIAMHLKKLGKGEPLKGWRKVERWEKKLRSGKAIENIWEEMRQNDKKVFQERN
jgi:hypothetical protein